MIDKNEYLRKLHKEILDVLDTVVDVCKKNNLKYYLIGGTLLGAVRHEGFIPWDDDLDICMPRKDFEKFIQVARNELPDNMELLWSTTERRYWLPFAKVANRNTLFEEKSNNQAQRLYGIFVDIFPLDSSRGYSRSIQFRSYLVRKLKVAMFQKAGARDCTGFRKVVKIVPWNAMRYALNKIMLGSRKDREGMYYSSFCSQYNIKKQTMPKEWYGNGVDARFEDRVYRIPDNCEAVLSSVFGKNYMDIPPEEKRRTHYPLKVIFSDGKTLEFMDCDKRVEVE